ncbi:Predicted membrane protein [Tsukamurella paurometabola]|uniref:Predicted membrane protein n=1 Tax=Tsukamurella paurometabola TaxID=2061 RepID=A0A3P8MD69_TSUPA|nr:Predicted membrane protein [Tsukamurella paurometabola]
MVIGRFQRWNSWDLVTRPDAVIVATLDWVTSPFSYVQSTGVAVAVAAFFGLAYLTIWSLTPPVTGAPRKATEPS